MKQHKGFDPNNVKELVEGRFDRLLDEPMPELLSEFCTLLGNEKEKWAGAAAMEVCIEEFEKGRQDSSKNHQRDFENFLFSPNRYIPIVIPGSDSPNTSQAVILGVVSQNSIPPPNPKTLKGLDNPSTSQAVIPGAVSQTSVPPPNLKTLKGSDSTPCTSQAVILGAVSQTSVPPANPKTLKVKIYMGSGWEEEFPELAPPSLWVKINVEGDKSQENDKKQQNDKKEQDDKSRKTQVQKKTWTPCWGEEFEFSLSTLEDAKLSLEVHNDKPKHGFLGKACVSVSEQKPGIVGKACVSVSELKPGIRVIALSDIKGNPCNSTWLLMRFML